MFVNHPQLAKQDTDVPAGTVSLSATPSLDRAVTNSYSSDSSNVNSVANSALNSNVNSTPISPKLDNSLATDPPKKKRKSTLRACDACAIRKVKCEVQRPCKHCIANGLKCTQLRERKKSGPKNLHRKTLDSINSISERNKMANLKFDLNYKPELTIIVSNHNDHPIEMLPDSLTGSLATNDTETDKYTTQDLIEVLCLIKEPMINSILREVSIKSTLDNYSKLVGFIKYSMPNILLDLIISSSDPTHLSKILMTLSVALLVIENLSLLTNLTTKYNYLKSANYYKSLKKVLLFKMLEIFQIIDKCLLYPTLPLNQNQIFYNQSTSCINLCHYFNVTYDHDKLYVNQQKAMYLRRAITYYQLLNTQDSTTSTGDNPGKTFDHYQLKELFERLFMTERYHYLTCTNLINSTNLFDLNISLNSNNSLFKMIKLINNDNLIFHKLKSYNVLLNLHRFFKINHYPDPNNLLTRDYLNLRVSMTNLSKQDPFYSLLNQILIFKVLMIYSNNLELSFIENELMDIVKSLNKLLQFDDLVYLKAINFNLLPQLLQILKINIDFENSNRILNDLIEYTDRILPFLSTIQDVESMIKSNKIIFDWFEEISKVNIKVGELFHPFGDYGFRIDNVHINKAIKSQINTKNQLPEQLHFQLQKLQRTQEVPKDKAELKDLLKEFGKEKAVAPQTGLPQSLPQNIPQPYVPTPGLSRQYLPSSTLLPQLSPSIPLTQSATSLLQNANSASYSALIQSPGLPVPPMIATASFPKKDDETPTNLNFVSESSKNLYNLFAQMNDEVPSNSNSLTNLLQAGTSNSNLVNLSTNINGFLNNLSSLNLNKIASLSNIKPQGNLQLINSNSTLNLFMNNEDEDDEDKQKQLKSRFML